MVNSPKRTAAAGSIMGAALLLSACGGSSNSAAATKSMVPASGPAQVSISGNEFSFSNKNIRLTVGQPVQFSISNTGRVDHDMKSNLPVRDLTYVQADNDQAEQQENAASGTLDIDYKIGHTAKVTFTPTTPGTYQFFCDVPGHKEAGMTGTFVVS